jgi:hypothetical protein
MPPEPRHQSRHANIPEQLAHHRSLMARAHAPARTHADEIDEIDGIGPDLRVLHPTPVTRLTGLSDENARPNLTNLVTPTPNLVTNLVTQNSRSDPISPISSLHFVYRGRTQR